MSLSALYKRAVGWTSRNKKEAQNPAVQNVVVYAPGVWDLLHVGHVSFLQRARSLGTALIVGVPSDATVIEDKGRPPIIPCNDRVKMLRALVYVDHALPYSTLDFLNHLNLFQPSVLAIGQNWGKETRHKLAEHWAERNGCRIVILPYTQRESTTKIKERVRERV